LVSGKIKISITILTIFVAVLMGCSENKEGKLIKAVNNYYERFQPLNKGETKIFAIKPFKNQYLVLAEKYRGDGHNYTYLFLIDQKFNVTKYVTGYRPTSACFEVNRLEYESNTILFGDFIDSKWVESDMRQAVKLDKIFVEFKDGVKYEESVSMDKGYIIVENTLSDVKIVNLYNDKGELQSNLEDLRKFRRNIINDTDFINVS